MAMMGTVRRAWSAAVLLAAFGAVGAAAAGEAVDSKALDDIVAGLSDPGRAAGANGALEALCLAAGRPGAEAERRAVAEAIAARLGPAVPADARVWLVRGLEAIGRDECVPALAKLLAEEDPPIVRETARRALEANPTPQALRAIRKAYNASAGDWRAALIRSIGKRRDSLSVGGLLDDARSEEKEVRLAALAALAEIGDRSAVDVFEETLPKAGGDEDAVRRSYLRLAETMGENEEGGAARRIYIQALGFGGGWRVAALVGLGRAGLPADAPVLLDGLKDPDPKVRGAAREGLGLLRGKNTTKNLADRLAGASPDLAGQLAAVLGKRADPAAAPALIALLSGADAAVRIAAIEALGKTGGEGAAVAIGAAASDPDPAVRAAANRARGKGADPKAAAVPPAPPTDFPPGKRAGAQLYVWTQQLGAKGRKIEDHLEEVFASTRAAGFESVQGWMSWFETPESAERTAKLLEKHRLTMPSAYAGGAMHEEEGARRSIESILRLARNGKPHGLRIVVMNPDAIGREKTDAELTVQAKALDRLGGELSALGMALAIHSHDPEMRSQAREWYHILRNTDPAKVGFCLDLHWIYRGKQDPYRLLEDAGKRIYDLHLRNSTGGVWSEDLGDGDIDHRKVKEILGKIGFKGLLTVELAYEAGTKPSRTLEEDLRRSRQYVKTIFGE